MLSVGPAAGFNPLTPITVIAQHASLTSVTVVNSASKVSVTGTLSPDPANAQWFYDHFGIGDVVEMANSGGPKLPIWDTYGDWELPWSQWQAGS